MAGRIEVLHHEETIAAYAAQVAAEPDVLGLVVVGSVARAAERSTSDVDVYLVVTDQAYAAAQATGRVAYIDADAATYDSYVDIKLASPRYLERAVAYATIRPGPRFSGPGSSLTEPGRWPRP